LASEPIYNILLQYMDYESERKNGYTPEILKAYILQLLILVLRNITSKSNTKDSHENWKQMMVLEVEYYIQKNYSNSIKLEAIAQEMCISPNYLNKIYKTATGKTIMQHVLEYKIDQSRNLLMDTDNSINSIALQLGFYDQYHFTNAFKKTAGLCPSEYRKSKLDITSSG
jgi:AraC-like DNA-binding protein